MSADGPSKQTSDKQAEEAYTEIMELLQKKYGVGSPPVPTAPMFVGGMFQEEMTKVKTRLKTDLHSLFFLQACEDF